MEESPESSGLDLAAIAARLREVVEASKLSATDFAEKVNTPYSTFRAYTSGGRNARAPSAELLAAVFHLFEFMPSWVLTGVGPRRIGEIPSSAIAEEFVAIPRHHVAASAGPGALNGEDSPVGGLCFSRAWLNKRGLNPSGLLVIDVVGSSMEGKLSDGDAVLIDKNQTTPKSGFAYVLRQGDELLVKYCQLMPEGILRVSSENKSFEPYDINLAKVTDVSILGRVVASTHEW